MKQRYLWLMSLSLIALISFGCSKINPIAPSLESGMTARAMADAASSLKAYWKLDGNLQDSSGDGNNAFLYTDPAGQYAPQVYVPGPRGQALTFEADRFSGYLMMVNTAIDVPVNHSFAVSAFIYPQAISGYTDSNCYPIFYQRNPNLGGRYFALQVQYDGALTMTNGTVNCTSTQKVVFNSWSHVAGVYDKDEGKMKVYINGVLVGSAPATLDFHSSAFLIGGGIAPNHFKGRMDEIRIHDVALTPGQVASFYWKHKAVWALNGNVLDSTGNGNHGTNVNNQVTYAANGNVSAGVFNGSSYVSLPAPNFNNMSMFTLTAWVNPQSYSTYNYILSKNTPDRDFAFNITSAGKLNVHFSITGVGYIDCTSTQTIPLNQWTFVAAVWTGSQWQLYINNALVKTASGNGYAPQWIGGNMAIGALGGGGAYFTGKIDDVTITDCILSTTQLNQIRGLGCGQY